MAKWATILLIFLAGYCKGQDTAKAGEKSISYCATDIDVGYLTNFSTSSAALSINNNYWVWIKNRAHELIPGLGGEYNITAKQFLLDTYCRLGFGYHALCHRYFYTFWDSWFVSLHYKFSPKFNQQYICPEVNFYFIRLSYYVNLSSKESWTKCIYPSLCLYFDIAGPGAHPEDSRYEP